MRVITKLFAKEILLSTLFVLIGLVALFAFFDLIERLDDIGTSYSANYAFLLTALVLPSRIYEAMPLAVLLASVYTFSKWAANSEFTALRVAGMSPIKLVASLFLPAIILVAFTYAFGEVVAPWAGHYSIELKSKARDGSVISARNYTSGVWVRDLATDSKGKTLDRYINIRNLIAGDEDATGAWRMFEFDGNGVLLRLVKANSATFIPNSGWQLNDVTVTTYPNLPVQRDDTSVNPIKQNRYKNLVVESKLGPDILSVLTIKPEELSLRGLDKYLEHLNFTNQQTEHYEVAFWKKVIYPLAIFVMILISMPFAYMNVRSGGMALKIFCGVMLGIFFYAINNIFSYLGILNTWSPLTVSLAPTVMMFVLAIMALYYVEKR